MEWSIVYLLAILLIPCSCRADQRFIQTKPAEIVFAIDVSNVNEKVFDEVMVVVRELPSRLPMFEDGVRVGVVAFASNVEILNELTANKKELWATKKQGDLGKERKTDEGLKAAKRVLEKARPNVKQIVILITDGPPSILDGEWSHDPSRRRAEDAAMQLRGYGATIFVGLVVPYKYPRLFYEMMIAGESPRVMVFEDGRKFSDKIFPGIYDVIKCESGSVCVTQPIKTTSIGQTTLSTTEIEAKTTDIKGETTASNGISKVPRGKEENGQSTKSTENDPFPPWATAIVVTVGVAILIILTIVPVSNRERLPACFGHPFDRCLNDPRYHPEAIVMMHPKEPLVERGSEGSTVNSSGPLEANLPSFGDPMPEALKQGKEIDGPIDPVHNDVEYQMGRHEHGRKTAVKVADEKQADPIFLMQALGDLFVQHGAKNDAVGIQEPKMAAPKIPAMKKAAPKIPAMKKAAPKIPAMKKAAPKIPAIKKAPLKNLALKKK